MKDILRFVLWRK